MKANISTEVEQYYVKKGEEYSRVFGDLREGTRFSFSLRWMQRHQEKLSEYSSDRRASHNGIFEKIYRQMLSTAVKRAKSILLGNETLIGEALDTALDKFLRAYDGAKGDEYSYLELLTYRTALDMLASSANSLYLNSHLHSNIVERSEDTDDDGSNNYENLDIEDDNMLDMDGSRKQIRNGRSSLGYRDMDEELKKIVAETPIMKTRSDKNPNLDPFRYIEEVDSKSIFDTLSSVDFSRFYFEIDNKINTEKRTLDAAWDAERFAIRYLLFSGNMLGHNSVTQTKNVLSSSEVDFVRLRWLIFTGKV